MAGRGVAAAGWPYSRSKTMICKQAALQYKGKKAGRGQTCEEAGSRGRSDHLKLGWCLQRQLRLSCQRKSAPILTRTCSPPAPPPPPPPPPPASSSPAPTSRCSSRKRRSGVALKAQRREPPPPMSTWYCCCFTRSAAGLVRLHSGEGAQAGEERTWGPMQAEVVARPASTPRAAATTAAAANRPPCRRHQPPPHPTLHASPEYDEGSAGAAQHQAAPVQRVHLQASEGLWR